jgi:lipopolysaccharide transport system permease protein
MDNLPANPLPPVESSIGLKPHTHIGERLVYLRDLLSVLVSREMKLRYKRSTLGFAWSLLNPLAQMLVFSFIFRKVLPLNIPNYPAFLISGLLAWNWFNASLYQATDAIVGNRDLIRRPGFPTAILPVVTVTSHMVHFLLALPILAIFLAASGIYLTPAVLVLPLVIALQFIFTLSLAYLAATFHVTFRDTQYLLGIFLLLGFYLTPVFYDAGAIPQQYQAVYRINPMLDLIESYRLILLHGQLPSALSVIELGLVSCILLFVGFRVFKAASDRFVEEL